MVMREFISHDGLHKSRVITGYTYDELRSKKQAQLLAWDEQWRRKLEQDRKREERARAARDVAASMRLADKRTREAESIQTELDTILAESVQAQGTTIDDLRDHSPFDDPVPTEPVYETLPVEPNCDDERYNPTMPFLVSISPKKRAAFEAARRETFERDHEAWRLETQNRERRNSARLAQYRDALKDWQARRDEFVRTQAEANAEIDDLEAGFMRGEQYSVTQFYELAISSIFIPVSYERSVTASYEPDSKRLVVDYCLPSLDELPSLKSVTYVKSRNAFKESFYTAAFMKRKYESVTYQLVMRVIKCVSDIDRRYHNVDTVVLNGWVHSVDKATGHPIKPCVLSVSTSLEDFRSVNLAAVDPKAWFKTTKGISAASIASVTPIAPIVTLDREDRRFIDGYEVAGALNEGVNLAAMDW